MIAEPTPSADVLRRGYRGWCFTAHALGRMEEMGVAWRDVLAVVENPVLTYPASRLYPGATVAVGGILAIPFRDGKIVTVLYRGREGR